MAFARSALARCGQSGWIPPAYVYTSTDAHTAIDAAVINDLSDTLNVGDMTWASVHGHPHNHHAHRREQRIGRCRCV